MLLPIRSKQTIIDQVRPVVTLPGMDQETGSWENGGQCCFGARLAYALGVAGVLRNIPGLEAPDYQLGAEEFAVQLGINRAQLILMLRQAGASDDPFGVEEWPNEPGVVLDRLMDIEEVPDTRGADFIDGDFKYADLRGADFRDCQLYQADFDHADLRGAKFAGANVSLASFANVKYYKNMLDDATGKPFQYIGGTYDL